MKTVGIRALVNFELDSVSHTDLRTNLRSHHRHHSSGTDRALYVRLHLHSCGNLMSSTSSASYPAWQRIWDESQPRLLFIQRFLNQEQHPTPRITRVGKLDAELLDQELVQVLLDPLAKALSIVNVCCATRATGIYSFCLNVLLL